MRSMILRLTVSSSTVSTSTSSELFIHNFHFVEIKYEPFHAAANRRFVLLLSRLLQRRTDDTEVIEAVTTAGPFHAMPQDSHSFVITTGLAARIDSTSARRLAKNSGIKSSRSLST